MATLNFGTSSSILPRPRIFCFIFLASSVPQLPKPFKTINKARYHVVQNQPSSTKPALALFYVINGEVIPSSISSSESSRTDQSSVANDIFWFGKDYRRFYSYLECSNGQRLKVIGVGTVRLRTQRYPLVEDPMDRKNHSKITIHQVFHCPDAPCNVLGDIDFDTEYVRANEGPYGEDIRFIGDEGERPVAFLAQLDPNVEHLQLQLSPPPIGPKVGSYIFKKLDGLDHMLHFMELPQSQSKRLYRLLSKRDPLERLLRSERAEIEWLCRPDLHELFGCDCGRDHGRQHRKRIGWEIEGEGGACVTLDEDSGWETVHEDDEPTGARD